MKCFWGWLAVSYVVWLVMDERERHVVDKEWRWHHPVPGPGGKMRP